MKYLFDFGIIGANGSPALRFFRSNGDDKDIFIAAKISAFVKILHQKAFGKPYMYMDEGKKRVVLEECFYSFDQIIVNGENLKISNIRYRVSVSADRKIEKEDFKKKLKKIKVSFEKRNDISSISGQFLKKNKFMFDIDGKKNLDINKLLKGSHPSFRSILNLNLSLEQVQKGGKFIVCYNYDKHKEKKALKEKEEVYKRFLEQLKKKIKKKEIKNLDFIVSTIEKEKVFLEKSSFFKKNF